MGVQIWVMLEIIRQIDLSFIVGRTRATRSVDDFSRPFGKPFRLALGREETRRGFRIPVSWNESPVEFSLLPLSAAKVPTAKFKSAAKRDRKGLSGRP